MPSLPNKVDIYETDSPILRYNQTTASAQLLMIFRSSQKNSRRTRVRTRLQWSYPSMPSGRSRIFPCSRLRARHRFA